MARRNSDGTFRNNNRPTKVSTSIQITRWLEAEVLRLKQLGLSYPAIVKRIIEVSRREQRAMTPLPLGIDFPTNYKISVKGCQKAFHRALQREPTLAADELRYILMQRAEEMILALQPTVQNGEPGAILAAVRVSEFEAKINGILPPKVSVIPSTCPDAVSMDLVRRIIDDKTELYVLPEERPKPAAITAIPATDDDQPAAGSIWKKVDGDFELKEPLSAADLDKWLTKPDCQACREVQRPAPQDAALTSGPAPSLKRQRPR